MKVETKKSKKAKRKGVQNLEMELFKCEHSDQLLIQIGPNKFCVNGARSNSIKKLSLGTFSDLCK